MNPLSSLRSTLVLVSYDAIIFIIWGCADTPTPILTMDKIDKLFDVWSCSSSVLTAWQLLLMLPKFIALARSAMLAYKIREVTKNFNESKYVGIALYNLLFISIVTIVLMNILEDIEITFVLGCIGVYICTCSTILIMMIPKIFNMYNNDTNDNVSKYTTDGQNQTINEKYTSPNTNNQRVLQTGSIKEKCPKVAQNVGREAFVQEEEQ
jgi:hypothetical protein